MSVADAVVAAAQVTGWMSTLELRWLAERASERETVVEVGSWMGRSTKALGMCVRGVVYAVDHWLGSPAVNDWCYLEIQKVGADGCFDMFKKNVAEEVASGRIVPVKAESAEAARQLTELLPGGADMVFIDGDHEYEEVKRDIALWRPLVKKGGLLSGHDYKAWPGVTKAVDEIFPGRALAGTIWFVEV